MFEAVELITDVEVRVRINIKGRQKVLVSCNPLLIHKIGEFNLGEGSAICLYYTNAEAWDIDRVAFANPAVDKNFRKDD